MWPIRMRRSLRDQSAAWRFVIPLTVKIIGEERGKHQVEVEMATPGRLLGSTWFLDADAPQQ